MCFVLSDNICLPTKNLIIRYHVTLYKKKDKIKLVDNLPARGMIVETTLFAV